MWDEVRRADFWVPPLGDLAAVMREGLAETYEEVAVTVGPCPDLTAMGCAFAGLGGDPFLIEIGGEPLVHNPAYRDRGSLDLSTILAECGRPNGKVIGAGFPSLVATGGKCGELMPCLEMTGRNLSKVARVGADKECLVEDYPSHLHGGLGNLYVCDGQPGEVIHVKVRRRVGDEASFSQGIRKAVTNLVEGQNRHEIALGGVFNVLTGQVRAHVSPDFECIPFAYYDSETETVTRPDFLQFYEGMGPDLFCMSVLWTGDPTGGALNLRPSFEHTHFFSTKDRAEAGHYHFDVSPETISYEGYFHPAGHVARVADIYRELEERAG